MPSYYIHMDQGIAADLRNYSLCSGQFSSCAPIVMHNDQSHIGALYHLAGCNSLDEIKINHLMTLMTVIKPTVAYVLQGTGDTYAGVQAAGHVNVVSNLILMEGIRVEHAFNRQVRFGSITVSERGGCLHIYEGYDSSNKLNTRTSIAALPDDVGFVGENREEHLAKWL